MLWSRPETLARQVAKQYSASTKFAAAGVLPEGEPEALVGAEATAGAAADADVLLDADIDPTNPAAAPEGLLEEDADGEGADGGEQ